MNVKSIMGNQLKIVAEMEKLLEKVSDKADAEKVEAVQKYCSWMRQVTEYTLEFEKIAKKAETEAKQDSDFFN